MADTLIKDRGSGLQRQFWRTGSARSLDNPWQPGRKQIAEQVHLWRSSVAAVYLGGNLLLFCQSLQNPLQQQLCVFALGSLPGNAAMSLSRCVPISPE